MTYQAQRKNNLTNIIQSATTSSTTSNNTEPGVFSVTAEELEDIRDAYVPILGPLNIVKANVIERALSCGIKPEAIIHAINETALAPRPSHAYLSAILTRYMNMGITDMAAILRENAQREQSRAEANASKWAWYATPADEMPF